MDRRTERARLYWQQLEAEVRASMTEEKFHADRRTVLSLRAARAKIDYELAKDREVDDGLSL